MNPRIILIVATFILIFTTAHTTKAQRYVDRRYRNSLNSRFSRTDKLTFIVGTGLSVVNSDNRGFGYKSDINLIKANGFGLNTSIGAIYQLSPYFGVLGNIEYFRLKGYEDVGVNSLEQSVSFQSEGVSASGSVIVNLVSQQTLLRLYGRSLGNRMILIPYLKAGFGLIRYSASSHSGGKEIMLAGTNYPAIDAVFPIGGGLRFRCSNKLSIAPELTFNITSTDHLDNKIESGGYTGKNDQFITASFKILYTPAF